MNLVTGATGIVGAHLALKLLQEAKPVIAIKRDASDITKTKKLFSYYGSDAEILFDKIKWINADLMDIYSILDALDGIEAVYHCAGLVSFDRKDKRQLYKTNVQGTANVVNACLEKSISALCHVSSIATLQNPDVTKNIDELISWKSSPTVSDYAISKYNAEREVWRGIEEGLNAVIVNPGIVFGPGFWNQSSGAMIESGYKGNPFFTKGSSAVVDARDVATCMVELVKKKCFNKRFVVVENNYTFKEIFASIYINFQHKEPTIEAGKSLLTLAKWFYNFRYLFSGKKRVITNAIVIAALDNNTYNNTRIKEELTMQFIPFSKTIEFVCQAYLKDFKK